MDIKVFYAWQSDLPGKLNHRLIRTAADDACARITADTTNNWNVTVDSDTKDTPGMCDIPATILQKIRECDIFLGDLSLVGKTGAGKMLPNSNVVFELGYAAKRLSFKALIGVINEAFGGLESQVFDIKRRRGVGYTATEGLGKPELTKITERLSKDLETIIRSTIEKVVLPKRGASVSQETRSAEEMHGLFAKRVLAGQFHNIKQPAVVTSVYFGRQAHLEYERIGEAVRDLFAANPVVDADAYAWASYGALTEFSLSGYLHRACVRDYKSALDQREQLERSGTPTGKELLLHAQPLHRNIVSGVLATARFVNRLQIKTPWHITISLVGFHGFAVIDDAGNASPRPIGKDILHLPVQRLTKIERMRDGVATGTFLRPALEALTRSVGWEFNWFFSHDGQFNLRVA